MRYDRNASEVARDLVGRVIDVDGKRAEIVETEAFEGGEQTSRRHCMLLAPGQIGVMSYRGLHFMNVGSEAAGVPSCVLIRSVIVNGQMCEGPGRVGKALDAQNLEYKVLERDIPVTGTTRPSEFSEPDERSDNSKGRYRLK
jgi:3-methyladenine DNA glycosylase Mpg